MPRDKANQARLAREHYQRNANAVKARALAAKRLSIERNIAIMREAKDQPCEDCGARYPHYVMDLDHVRDAKVAAVSRMVRSGASEARLRKEIAKCDVVCSNCHRGRTWERLLDSLA